ncbi:AroE Shikimate 5-dehydrogenase [Rhabdaerophilaceae bacterium]
MKRALVIGSPIAHSRSPLVHGFWLKAYNIQGRYDREEVLPHQVTDFLRMLPSRGIAGCNVTIPNKEAAFLACDITTPAAAALRAVNTVWFENSAMHGDNTDGSGFLAHIDDVHPGWDKQPGRILLLGAGGAARGLGLALLARKPAELAISNRTDDRASRLIADIQAAEPEAPLSHVSWAEKAGSLSRFDLLINTTSAGMQSKDALDLSLETAKRSAIISDIVYVPLETPLLAEARQRQLKTLDGLGMLLHQAVPGFARWFGVKPEVTPALRAHIVANL